MENLRADHRRPRGDPRSTRPGCSGHQGRAGRGEGALRRRPPLRDHLRHRRHRHRGPHRRRGAGRHDVAAGLREDRPVRRVPRPGPRRPRRGRGQARATTTTSRTSSPPPRTPTCCSSPTAAACTGSRPTRSPDEGPHGPRHRHRQPAAPPARRAHPGHHRHPRLRDATGTCSSPPARARSRRPSSTSTTRRCAAASSPSTCATATSW